VKPPAGLPWSVTDDDRRQRQMTTANNDIGQRRLLVWLLGVLAWGALQKIMHRHKILDIDQLKRVVIER